MANVQQRNPNVDSASDAALSPDEPWNRGPVERDVGRRERSRSARAAAVGFSIEAGLAAVALVLTVFGLLEVGRSFAAPAAVILVALGLLVASWSRRFAAKARTRETGMAEVGAISSEYLMDCSNCS